MANEIHSVKGYDRARQPVALKEERTTERAKNMVISFINYIVDWIKIIILSYCQNHDICKLGN